jgi:hypothetical protein
VPVIAKAPIAFISRKAIVEDWKSRKDHKNPEMLTGTNAKECGNSSHDSINRMSPDSKQQRKRSQINSRTVNVAFQCWTFLVVK